MRSRRACALTAGLLGALLLAACGESGPPYGFDVRPEQHFRLESRVDAEISGEKVHIERFADFELRRSGDADDGYELDLRLERYVFVREGPNGTSELAISRDGVVSRDAEFGEQRLGPEARTPSGVSLRELLSRPMAGVPVASDGARAGPIWRSADPLLAEVQILEWFLLALPRFSGDQVAARGSREVPRTGAYRLGVQLPLLYQAEATGIRGWTVSLSGSAQRSELELAPGLAGEVELDLRGETLLRPDRGLERADLELVMRFTGADGERVQVAEHVRIALLEGALSDGRVNSPELFPDNGEE